MNKYLLFRILLILSIMILAILYSVPNLYFPSYAIEISNLDTTEYEMKHIREVVMLSLNNAEIKYNSIESTNKSIIFHLKDKNEQLRAKEIVNLALEGRYVVVLNLVNTTPLWLQFIGSKPMKLGLDLLGGIHFLLEVDIEFALDKKMEVFRGDIRTKLRNNRIRGFISKEGRMIVGKFSTINLRKESVKLVKEEVVNLILQEADISGKFMTYWVMNSELEKIIIDDTVKQNLKSIRNRINALGISSPLIQQQGKERILVELPGMQDLIIAKRILGRTANLEFRLEGINNKTSEIFNFRNLNGNYLQASLLRSVIITGNSVLDANAHFDSSGLPNVNISLDNEGAKKIYSITKQNIGHRLGVLFIERKIHIRKILDKNGFILIKNIPFYEKEIISLATIQSALSAHFQITGLSSIQEARELALLLRSGAFSAPIDFIEERIIGPSLGQENIEHGIYAVIFALILIMLFMILYYKDLGYFANIILFFNVILIISIMSILSATLTLSGIAGIVLTLGMAVDSNILIFERIKENILEGISIDKSILLGFDRAFITILDANITTFLVSIIIFFFGTGSVKGFAITLLIGLITSMFTSVFSMKTLVLILHNNNMLKKLVF